MTMQPSFEFTGKSKSHISASRFIQDSLIQLLPELGDSWSSKYLFSIQRDSLSRILFLDFIYQKILDVPGHILEVGVQYGASLSQLIALRSIYEPYNARRIICGFDTFEGLRGVSNLDNTAFKDGDYSVPANFAELLNAILKAQEQQNPLSEIQKYKLFKGDATETVSVWLEENPNVPLALALFDFDIYEPTIRVLRALEARLIPGSIIVFDEFNHPMFPGERAAALEFFGNSKFRFNPLYGNAAFLVFGL